MFSGGSVRRYCARARVCVCAFARLRGSVIPPGLETAVGGVAVAVAVEAVSEMGEAVSVGGCCHTGTRSPTVWITDGACDDVIAICGAMM